MNRANRTPFFKKQEQSFFRPVTHIQPKLTVNKPNDIYEKEADAVADKVMRMSDPQIHRHEEQEEEMLQMKEYVPAIQRKCEACEAEEKLQRKPLAGHITPFFQRKEAGGGEVSQQIAASLQSTKGGGRALPKNTRSWMESRFGADFSGVKVHTDSNAVQLSRDLNAKAFTHGSDIYFNRGKFAPETNEGKRLLAHELTHVEQQEAVPATDRLGCLRIGSLPTIQRDLAVEPTNPDTVPAELTEDEINDAIDYNRRRFTRDIEIEQLRDVLGISLEPKIIDEDFILSLVRYQAVFGLTQDGKLGPITASNLSREFRGEAAFLGRDGRELRRQARRLDRRSFTIRVTQPARELTDTGSAEYAVQWGVPDPQANGWIIQHVAWAANKEDCDGNDVATNNDDGLEFWEGWEVRTGRVFIGSSANAHVADTFRTVDEGADTRGTVTITGRVTFMPDFDLRKPPWGHTVPEAGALPTLTVAPPGWSDGFARLHRMTVTWDDCVDPATHEVRAVP